MFSSFLDLPIQSVSLLKLIVWLIRDGDVKCTHFIIVPEQGTFLKKNYPSIHIHFTDTKIPISYLNEHKYRLWY